jgi:hypothetical protein
MINPNYSPIPENERYREYEPYLSFVWKTENGDEVKTHHPALINESNFIGRKKPIDPNDQVQYVHKDWVNDRYYTMSGRFDDYLQMIDVYYKTYLEAYNHDPSVRPNELLKRLHRERMYRRDERTGRASQNFDINEDTEYLKKNGDPAIERIFNAPDKLPSSGRIVIPPEYSDFIDPKVDTYLVLPTFVQNEEHAPFVFGMQNTVSKTSEVLEKKIEEALDKGIFVRDPLYPEFGEIMRVPVFLDFPFVEYDGLPIHGELVLIARRQLEERLGKKKFGEMSPDEIHSRIDEEVRGIPLARVFAKERTESARTARVKEKRIVIIKKIREQSAIYLKNMKGSISTAEQEKIQTYIQGLNMALKRLESVTSGQGGETSESPPKYIRGSGVIRRKAADR